MHDSDDEKLLLGSTHICLSGLWCLEQMRQEDPLHGGLSQLSCLFSTLSYPITHPWMSLCILLSSHTFQLVSLFWILSYPITYPCLSLCNCILFLWCVDSSHTFQLSSLFWTLSCSITYPCLNICILLSGVWSVQLSHLSAVFHLLNIHVSHYLSLSAAKRILTPRTDLLSGNGNADNSWG